ncbi:hypothetical protein ES703_35129 [subsurface metagenome]
MDTVSAANTLLTQFIGIEWGSYLSIDTPVNQAYRRSPYDFLARSDTQATEDTLLIPQSIPWLLDAVLLSQILYLLHVRASR